MAERPGSEEEGRGQLETAGTALLAVGTLALLVGAPLTIAGITVPLIEVDALAVTGVVVGTVGAAMRWAGR